MITIQLKEILQIVPILQSLSQQSFIGSISFKISRLIRELDKELALMNKAKQDIIEEYGKRDEEGKLIITDDGQVKISDAEKCNIELQKLLDTTVEINANKLPIDIFDSIQISPVQANILEMIVE